MKNFECCSTPERVNKSHAELHAARMDQIWNLNRPHNEISLKLARALGWEDHLIQVDYNAGSRVTVFCPRQFGSIAPNPWRRFDYRDADIAWALGSRFDIFPRHTRYADKESDWVIPCSSCRDVTVTADTPEKAVAAAVILYYQQS